MKLSLQDKKCSNDLYKVSDMLTLNVPKVHYFKKTLHAMLVCTLVCK